VGMYTPANPAPPSRSSPSRLPYSPFAYQAILPRILHLAIYICALASAGGEGQPATGNIPLYYRHATRRCAARWAPRVPVTPSAGACK